MLLIIIPRDSILLGTWSLVINHYKVRTAEQELQPSGHQGLTGCLSLTAGQMHPMNGWYFELHRLRNPCL
jgi:hypothetical protein